MTTMYSVQLLGSYMVVKDDFHYSEMVALRGSAIKGLI